MVSLPTASPEELQVAVPPFNGTVARVVDPVRNVTVPVGAPDPEVGVTIAVSVTGCPLAAGFSELLRATLVLPRTAPVSFRSTAMAPVWLNCSTTTSGRPSPFTSPTAMATFERAPTEVEPKAMGAWNVPSPFPARTATAPDCSTTTDVKVPVVVHIGDRDGLAVIARRVRHRGLKRAIAITQDDAYTSAHRVIHGDQVEEAISIQVCHRKACR